MYYMFWQSVYKMYMHILDDQINCVNPKGKVAVIYTGLDGKTTVYTNSEDWWGDMVQGTFQLTCIMGKETSRVNETSEMIESVEREKIGTKHREIFLWICPPGEHPR